MDNVFDDAKENKSQKLSARRQPLFFFALLFVLGSYIGTVNTFTPSSVTPFIAISLILFFVCFYFARKNNVLLYISSIIVSLLTIFTAILIASFSKEINSTDIQLIRDIAEESQDVIFRGRVTTPPRKIAMKNGSHCLVFNFNILEIPSDYGGEITKPTDIRVVWFGPQTIATPAASFPTPDIGTGWQLHGKLKEIPTRSNIPILKLSISGRDRLCVQYPKYDLEGISLRINQLRTYASNTLFLGMEDFKLNAEIVNAMVLGYNSDIPFAIKNFFSKSGTIHIFAISGLHVGIVGTILMTILGFTTIKPKYRMILFALTLGLYTIITGGNPSTIRAFIMTTIFFCVAAIHRKSSLPYSIAIACIFSLAIVPCNITNIGFILSFACVIGITIFSIPLTFFYKRASTEFFENETIDVLMSPTLAQSKRHLSKIAYIIAQSLIVSIAAFIASSPITAMFFDKITPVSILCNLLVIPLAFIVVTTAVLSIIGGLIHPELAIIFNYANVGFTDALIYIAEKASNIPYAYIKTANWGATHTFIWYTFFIVIALVMYKIIKMQAIKKQLKLY